MWCESTAHAKRNIWGVIHLENEVWFMDWIQGQQAGPAFLLNRRAETTRRGTQGRRRPGCLGWWLGGGKERKSRRGYKADMTEVSILGHKSLLPSKHETNIHCTTIKMPWLKPRLNNWVWVQLITYLHNVAFCLSVARGCVKNHCFKWEKH